MSTELSGIALGMLVAVLWGLADSIATLATRRLTTFKTTLLSQSTGLLALTFFGLFSFWPLFAPVDLLPSAGAGVLTGIFASIGYFALYRALEIGPVALISPLSSTSAVVTLFLSVVLLGEHVTGPLVASITIVLSGVVLASSNHQELLHLLQSKRGSLWMSKGVLWAFVAVLAFGSMDFGIGASARSYGWYLPVFWTRLYSVLILIYVRLRFSQRGKPLQWDSLFFVFTAFQATLLAVLAGILENMAVLTFSITSRIIQPGITAAVASNYSVVAVLFGVFVFRERLKTYQMVGIGLVFLGLTVLAFVS